MDYYRVIHKTSTPKKGEILLKRGFRYIMFPWQPRELTSQAKLKGPGPTVLGPEAKQPRAERFWLGED